MSSLASNRASSLLQHGRGGSGACPGPQWQLEPLIHLFGMAMAPSRAMI